MRRLFANLTCVLVLLSLTPGFAVAQDGTISGTAIDAETGEAVPGVNVILEGTQFGTASNVDGYFTFEAPAGDYTLAASFVGYETFTTPVTVTVGEETEVDVELVSDFEQLSEIVVTGVSTGTSTLKTAFDVSKVSAQQLEQVPGTDPASALRAKAPGVRIIQPSGRPGSSPEIRLRGSKSIGGNQGPLIVVDGAITGGSLQDIDMQTVETIEIIKGSAASSLYGSLGANGVIQVVTKRGANQAGQTRVTIRNEFGFSSLANEIDLAEHHGFAVEEGTYRLPLGEDDPQGAVGSPRGDDDPYILDNDYDQVINQQEKLFTAQPFMTNFASIAARQNNINYLLSFENLMNSGVVQELQGYQRRNIRLNVDNQASERLNLSASVLYSNSSGPNNSTILGQGQGANIFYGILLAEPDLDLTESVEDPETGEMIEYNPFIAGGNAENPLYVASQRDIDQDRERILGNIRADFSIAPWWTVDGQFSFDREAEEVGTYIPRGTLSAGSPPSEGFVFRGDFSERIAIGTFRSLFNREIGDLNGNLTFSYAYEDRLNENLTADVSQLLAQGVPTIGNSERERQGANSYRAEVKAENIAGNLALDFKDRYILDAVLRRDGLSLFGADVRYQTYYRVAGAYRLTQDVTLPGFNEIKLRASYGTSGQRPPFSAQYETFNVTPAGITRNILGNSEIKPSTVAELELGVDARLFDRFFLVANYADAIAEDQFLLVPLSAGQPGNFQWQNAGTLASNTIELGINGTLIERDDYSLDFNLNFDRTRQEITELNRPEFTQGTDFGAAISVFRVQEGVPFGAMFGNQLAGSVDDLNVNGEGIVIGSEAVYGEPLTPSDFTINSDGYVIRQGTEYTADEQAMYIYGEDGGKAVVQIGNATPDFNVGFGTTFQYKGFSLYGLLDWEQGGDVYNYTRQLLYFNARHGDLDQSGRQPNVYRCENGTTAGSCGDAGGIALNEDGTQALVEGNQHWGTYYEGQLYNQASASSYFVEDATYLKVREISLSYSFSSSLLNRIGVGNALYGARISVIGRNLFTFTRYTGFDPEVAVDSGGANPTNFRIDEFAYPNFRTFAFSLELRL